MGSKSVSRRDILKSLTMGAMAGSVLRVIPAQAAEYAHHLVDAEKAAAPGGSYTPKFFRPQQYKTLQALGQAIIPPEGDTGGAIQAGAPEFIYLLASEKTASQLKLSGGLVSVDATCTHWYRKAYIACAPPHLEGILRRL